MLAPYGDADPAEVLEGFRTPGRALVAGGVDLLTVETMIDLAEAVLAVQAAREALGRRGGPGHPHLRTQPPRVVHDHGQRRAHRRGANLAAAGADVVGSNCGQGTAGMLAVAREFAEATDLPLMIQANAGLPVLTGGRGPLSRIARRHGCAVLPACSTRA